MFCISGFSQGQDHGPGGLHEDIGHIPQSWVWALNRKFKDILKWRQRPTLRMIRRIHSLWVNLEVQIPSRNRVSESTIYHKPVGVWAGERQKYIVCGMAYCNPEHGDIPFLELRGWGLGHISSVGSRLDTARHGWIIQVFFLFVTHVIVTMKYA